MHYPPHRKTPSYQRKRRNTQLLHLLRYGLLAVAVFVGIYIFQMQKDLHFGADVFYPGTYINGISLSGMTYEQAQEALAQQESQLLEDSVVTLRYGDRAWQISTAQIGATLDATEMLDQAWSYARTGSASQRRSLIRRLRTSPIVLASTLTYDEEVIQLFVNSIKEEIDIPTVSAQITIAGFEQLSVSPSQNGLTLDADALHAQLLQALTGGGRSEILLTPVETAPEYTTQQLLDATHKLSGKSTSTAESSSDRTHNIRQALSSFNGLCVPAGATVSFNDIVGDRSQERGYRSAAEYAGTSIQVGYGGGVCQASSTLYVNLLYAGIHVEQRSPHNMTVAYTKPSLDAAVADSTNANPKDLVFVNDTGYPLYFFTSVDEERAYVSIFGKPSPYEIQIVSEVLQRDLKSSRVIYKADKESRYVYYDNETVKASSGKTGLRSQAWRNFLLEGEIISTERLSVDTYEAQPDVYWRGIHPRPGN